MNSTVTSLRAWLARPLELINTNYGTHRGYVRHLLGQMEGALGPRDRFRRIDPAKVQRLVFVCLGNINRSAFAHAVAAAREARCASIGLSTSTGARATEIARTIAPEHGISLDEHRATDISAYERQEGDLLLVMELRHAHRLVAKGVPEEQIALLGHWARPVRYHIHDPQTLSVDYFRSCFTVIESATRRLVAELEVGDSPSTRS